MSKVSVCRTDYMLCLTDKQLEVLAKLDYDTVFNKVSELLPYIYKIDYDYHFGPYFYFSVFEYLNARQQKTFAKKFLEFLDSSS